MSKKSTSSHGFTLIELIVFIILLGILTSFGHFLLQQWNSHEKPQVVVESQVVVEPQAQKEDVSQRQPKVGTVKLFEERRQEKSAIEKFTVPDGAQV